MIITGDSLDKLKELDENSIDSIVTDPPYGLSFMGKAWDHSVPSAELWKECLRVLKPGGYLLAFAGTRTQHRMAVNIEDAGFEIRDMIAWIYGSGFPKSLNIGKAVDKLQGNEREVRREVKFSAGAGMGLLDKSSTVGKSYTETKGNSPYEGWGTALKPALEPITVARKPISEKNIAQNVLKWGTGGVNIDGCRVESSQDDKEMLDAKASTNNNGVNFDVGESKAKGTATPANNLGRFPANLIHDGSDEVVGLLGEPARFFYCAKASKAERNKGLEGFEPKAMNDMNKMGGSENTMLTGSGNPRTTEYINHHPTVKPVKLMQYLVRLVTPKNGTVLDPFNGSGTTGIACKLEGFDYIGIELDPEYVKISEARIEAWEAETKVEQTTLV